MGGAGEQVSLDRPGGSGSAIDALAETAAAAAPPAPIAAAAPPDLGGVAANILDHIEDGFFACDRDWRIVHANRRARAQWAVEGDGVRGREAWALFPGIAGSDAERLIRDAAASGAAAAADAVAAGAGRVWRLRVDPVRPDLTLVLWRDVGDDRRIEEALYDSEARFRRVFEQSPLGKATAGPDFRFREVNPALCAMLGYSAAELTAMRFLDIVHPDDRADCLAQAMALAEGRIPHIQLEERFLRRSGEPVWVRINVGPIRDAAGRALYTLGIIENIDERKRFEAGLRELAGELEARVAARTRELAEANERLSRERLLSQLIVETAAEGIIVLDTEMRHLVWNAGMERINGRPRNSVLGKTFAEAFPHLVHHIVGQCWRQALSGHKAAMRDHHFYSFARGADVVYDADFTPLYDENRTIIGAVAILRETTDRHRIEEMLRQSQKLEAVAQLTGGVAHDFNNLLTAVVGYLDMIADEAGSERIAGLAEAALRSATRGARLTQQLLSFARRQALRPVTADLNALLAEIGDLLRRAAGESIDVVVEAAPDLASCDVDPAQFEAAAMNLVMNARDAMAKGGRLTLRTRNVAAADLPAESGLPVADYVALTVADTGEGMPPEVAARAFEPFFTTKEIGKGSGLGLSMVYGFAKQSGGGVRLESSAGAGTSVTIYLPRSAAADTPSGAVSRGVPQRGAGVILAVEDDEEVREASVAVLSSLGYRVLVAANGEEALATLRRAGPIDLLFTDLVMPGGVSGLALARQARAIRPGLKVLLTTGYTDSEEARSPDLPMIAKPFRPVQLSRALAALLGAPPT